MTRVPTLVALVSAVTVAQVTQPLPPPRPAETVVSLPTFSAHSVSGRQTVWTVRWTSTQSPGGLSATPPAADTNSFEVTRRVSITEAMVRERDPQLGTDELVVVALDAQGRELAWHHLKDPRLIRSEQPGRGGVLAGQMLYRHETELVVTVPDELAAATLHVYEVRWNGAAFTLRLSGVIPIQR